jgi:hypothetical protein
MHHHMLRTPSSPRCSTPEWIYGMYRSPPGTQIHAPPCGDQPATPTFDLPTTGHHWLEPTGYHAVKDRLYAHLRTSDD